MKAEKYLEKLNLPEKIFEQEVQEKFKELEEVLEGIDITQVIYETPLWEEKQGADFSVRVEDKHINDEILKSLKNRSQVWEKITRLINKWQDKNTAFSEKASDIWLEFDYDNILVRKEPSVFVDGSKVKHGNDNSWYLKEVFPILSGKEKDYINTKLNEELNKAIEAVTKNSPLFQLGVMVSRSTELDKIRICSEDFSLDDFIQVSKELSFEAPKKLLYKLDSYINDVYRVDFDVTESGLSEKFAIEVEVEHNKEKIEALMNYLNKEGYCTDIMSEKVKGWKSGLRNVCHLKIVCHKEDIKIKVYLREFPVEENAIGGSW